MLCRIVHIVGPGKGTLMRDILTIVNRFPDFKKAVTVHMVEISEFMRSVQKEELCEDIITEPQVGTKRDDY